MANKPIKTTGEVIEVLGGTTAVSQLIDTTYSSVANWRSAGKFPAHTYLILKKALRQKKRTASDDLWTMGRRAARD